jgi:hypothetical protein
MGQSNPPKSKGKSVIIQSPFIFQNLILHKGLKLRCFFLYIIKSEGEMKLQGNYNLVPVV